MKTNTNLIPQILTQYILKETSVSDQVENPEDRFSRVMAHIIGESLI